MKNAFFRIFLFLMVSLLFSNSLIKGALFVNYKINQAEITRKFCENKAKPTMHCDGKCHLAKQLEKQEKQEKPSSDSQKMKVEIVELTAQINDAISFVYPIQSYKTNNHYAYSEARSDAHLAEIFHPPTV